ncbi:MAG TPA: helix-turn-helix domain-containing protein [Allosphingosinicella sp.]|nr:helix-turn-helix domain-containing protein [Allosphingosinicella sp.]
MDDPLSRRGLLQDVLVVLGVDRVGEHQRRIASFLLDMKRIVRRTPSLALTQGTIARAVGGSRPKVNRCLKALERKGLIDWQGGSVPLIRDEAALRRLL